MPPEGTDGYGYWFEQEKSMNTLSAQRAASGSSFQGFAGRRLPRGIGLSPGDPVFPGL